MEESGMESLPADTGRKGYLYGEVIKDVDEAL